MEMSLRNILLAIAIFIAIILGYTIEEAVSDTSSTGATTNTQSHTGSGSNTTISGGYSQETTNNFSGGQTNTTTNSTTNNSNQETAVNSATAPAMSVYGQDSCVIPLSIGMTVIGFSTSMGTYYHDMECERRKKSKLLNALGMKVAAISLMCQDKSVWKSMMDAGTPCPIDGLIGEQAKQRWDELGNEKHLDNITNTSSRKFRHHR
jgi:hypothetical protein